MIEKAPANKSESLEKLITSLIGGLKGRPTFLQYLRRKVETVPAGEQASGKIAAIVKSEHDFWAALLRDQLEKYDLMRSEDARLQRDYAFVYFEFDDLFRYCKNPVKHFSIDLKKKYSSQEYDVLAEKFRKFIEDKRKTPWRILPMSSIGFLGKIYKNLFIQLFNFAVYILLGWSGLSFSMNNNFNWKARGRSRKEERAMDFWKLASLLSLIVNGSLFYVFYQIIAATRLATAEVFLLGILNLLFIPISTRTVVQLMRIAVSFYYSMSSKVAPIKTWQHLRENFSYVWQHTDQYHSNCFGLMLDDMYKNNYITEAQSSSFKSGQPPALPNNDTACYRIRRWMNKFYHLRVTGLGGPFAWDDLESLTVLVFSLNEKFFYSFGDLIKGDSRADNSTLTILRQLRKSYRDEWDNLIDRLKDGLSSQEEKCLRKGAFVNLSLGQAVTAAIEHWANMRLQSIYHTLENFKSLRRVYAYFAKQRFPELDNHQINKLIQEKLQIMFLHDMYPNYDKDDRQKVDIDRYLKNNPDVELYWPRELLHPSKYGSFANIIDSIRGKFLLMLDSDHHVDFEELLYFPYLFKVFKRKPQLAALGFRLYAFNEKYNLVTTLSSLSHNAWWGHDLRVKSLVGGGGVYGKMLIRTDIIVKNEFIQSDSVAEDMLAMARLIAYGANFDFSELVEVGQGEDISYYGLRNKLGRYPIGAVESASTKLYQEMINSPSVPLYRKLESIFMLSYYPIRDLGLTATEVGKYLGLSKSAVSRAANRGQKLIVDQFLALKK